MNEKQKIAQFKKESKSKLASILKRYSDTYLISFHTNIRKKSFTVDWEIFPKPSTNKICHLNIEVDSLIAELKEEWLKLFPEGSASIDPFQ